VIIEDAQGCTPVPQFPLPDGAQEFLESRRRDGDGLVVIEVLLGSGRTAVGEEVMEDRVGEAVRRLDGREMLDSLCLVAGLLGEFAFDSGRWLRIVRFQAAGRQSVVDPPNGLAPLLDDDDLVVGRDGENNDAVALGDVIEVRLGTVGQLDGLVDHVESRAGVDGLGFETVPR